MADTEYGVNSSSPASPGIGGAIKDLAQAASKFFAGRRNEMNADSQKYEDKVVNGEAGREDTRLDSHETSPE